MCASLRGRQGSDVKIRKEDDEWIREKRSLSTEDDSI